MHNGEIAKLLNRDVRTIWSTYDKAKKKLSAKLDISSDIMIPEDIFASRTLSVLESLVHFLSDKQGMSLKEIASRLKRNHSTIWTVHRRAKEKLKAN